MTTVELMSFLGESVQSISAGLNLKTCQSKSMFITSHVLLYSVTFFPLFCERVILKHRDAEALRRQHARGCCGGGVRVRGMGCGAGGGMLSAAPDATYLSLHPSFDPSFDPSVDPSFWPLKHSLTF
jgi:hypothetical protein